MERKEKSQKDIEKQIIRDIESLKVNLREKLLELIERGLDLDEVFYEMRDDEELKVEKNFTIDVEKSAITKQLKFRCLIGLQMTERRRNTEIQTYNVDFLVDHERT